MTTETIGTVCKRFSSGKGIAAQSIQPSGLYPVIGANGLRGYTGTFNFDGRCAVIGRQGAYCGNVRYFEGRAFMTEHAIVAEANENNDSGYLAYKLQEMNLAQYQGQSAQPGLSVNTLSNVRIEMPDLQTQVKVFNTLHKLDDKISNNNAISSQLESLAKTVYDYWFLQFDFPDENGRPYKSSGGKMVWNEELKREIPEGWKVTSLKGQYSIERGISYTSDDIKSGQGIPMLNLACIDTSRNYRDGALKYIGRKVSENDKLHGGEMLIACTDLTRNADIVGCPILVPQDGQTYTYSMDLAKLNSTNPSITEAYLFETLRTDFYHNYIKKWASGTNVLHLNLDGLEWYSIVIPPLGLQRRFSNILIPIEKKKNQLLVENRQLSSLRDFLLPMLMNGQVTFKEDA